MKKSLIVSYALDLRQMNSTIECKTSTTEKTNANNCDID